MTRGRAEGLSARARAHKPEIALFCLVFGAFAFFYQAGGWNQNTRFDLIRAMVERGTVRIDAFHENTGDKAKRGDHYYSDKAPGISLLSLPVYAVVHAIDGELQETDRFQGIASYLCTLWAVSLPSALAVIVLYRSALALGMSLTWGAALAVAYAFGTIALPYSTLLYGHQSTAAFAFIAFGLLLSIRHDLAAPSPGRLFVTGFCLGLALLIEYTAALSVALIAGYACLSVRPARRLIWIAAGAVLPILVLLAYHAVAFGGPFTLPYAFSTQTPRHRGFFMGLGVPTTRALDYLLIDEYRGLFYRSPWLLLALPATLLMILKRATRAEGMVCGGVAFLYVWLNASLTDWHGGAAMGPRHLVPTLPFLTLSLVGLLKASLPGWLRVLGAGGAAMGIVFSMALMFIGTAVKPEVPRAIEQPFQAFLFPAFAEGRVAINTQSIDMVTGGGRTTRQAWNLGEVAGLRGTRSLLPLAGYLLITGLWLAAAVRAKSVSDP